MRGFVRVGGHYVADLDAVERRILAGAFADTATLLGAALDDEPGLPAGEGDDDAPDADPLALLDWSAEPVPEPHDPAVLRLLPSASTEDPALAAEFRRLTESSLRRQKVAHLRAMWMGLSRPPGPLAVPRAEAPAWAAALTDVRLVLAARVGIETDEDAERLHDSVAAETDDVEGEVRAALAALYSALTWLQESLVQAMLDDVPPAGPDRPRLDLAQ